MLTDEQMQKYFPEPLLDPRLDIQTQQVSNAWREWITKILERSDLSNDTKWAAWKNPRFASWQQASAPNTDGHWLDYASTDEFLTRARAGNSQGFGALLPPFDGTNWDYNPPPSSFSSTQFYYDLLNRIPRQDPSTATLRPNDTPVWVRIPGSVQGVLRWEPTPDPNTQPPLSRISYEDDAPVIAPGNPPSNFGFDDPFSLSPQFPAESPSTDFGGSSNALASSNGLASGGAVLALAAILLLRRI